MRCTHSNCLQHPSYSTGLSPRRVVRAAAVRAAAASAGCVHVLKTLADVAHRSSINGQSAAPGLRWSVLLDWSVGCNRLTCVELRRCIELICAPLI